MAPYPKLYTPKNVEFLVSSEGNLWFHPGILGTGSTAFFCRFPLSRRLRRFPADCRLFESETADHLRSVTHRNLRQLRSGPEATTGSQLILIRHAGIASAISGRFRFSPRFSIASAFPHLAPAITRIFHFRCDISGTEIANMTLTTLFSLPSFLVPPVSGSKQRFFPGTRPRLYPAW